MIFSDILYYFTQVTNYCLKNNPKVPENNTGSLCVELYSKNVLEYPFLCDKKRMGSEVECLCYNNNFLLSALACIDHCSLNFEDSQLSYTYINDVCNTNIDFYKLLVNNKKYFRSLDNQQKLYEKYKQHVKEYNNNKHDQNNKSTSLKQKTLKLKPFVLFYPLFANSTQLNIVRSEKDEIQFNDRWSGYFGLALLAYWPVVFFTALLTKVLNNLPLVTQLHTKFSKVLSKLKIYSKKNLSHLLLANSTIGSYKTKFNVLFYLVFSLYVLLNVMFFLIKYRVSFTSESMIYKNFKFNMKTDLERELHDFKYHKFIGDRAGILALTQVPILVFTIGRCDIFIKLTSISKPMIKLLHLLVSVIVFAFSIVHIVLQLLFIKNAESVIHKNQYKYLSLLGIFALSIFLILISAGFKNHKYFHKFNGFHFLHTFGAKIFLFSMAYHVKKPKWRVYVYLSLWVWISEYITQAAKVIHTGLFNYGKIKLYFDSKLNDSVLATKIYTKHARWWEPKLGSMVYVRVHKAGLLGKSYSAWIVSKTKDDELNAIELIIDNKEKTENLSGNSFLQIQKFEKIRFFIEYSFVKNHPLPAHDYTFFYMENMSILKGLYLILESSKMTKSKLLESKYLFDSSNLRNPAVNLNFPLFNADDLENTVDVLSCSSDILLKPLDANKAKVVDESSKSVRVTWLIDSIQYLEILEDQIVYLSKTYVDIIYIEIYIKTEQDESHLDVKQDNYNIKSQLCITNPTKFNVEQSSLVNSEHISTNDHENPAMSFFDSIDSYPLYMDIISKPSLNSKASQTENFEPKSTIANSSSVSNDNQLSETPVSPQLPINSAPSGDTDGLNHDLEEFFTLYSLESANNGEKKEIPIEKPNIFEYPILNKLGSNVIVNFCKGFPVEQCMSRQVSKSYGSVGIVSCGSNSFKSEVKTNFVQISQELSSARSINYFDK